MIHTKESANHKPPKPSKIVSKKKNSTSLTQSELEKLFENPLAYHNYLTGEKWCRYKI